jgi:hypothetical protein
MYNTYQRCRASEVIPGGMNLRRYNGKLYAIDPKSPLSVKDLVDALTKGTNVKTLTRIAGKLGLGFRGTREHTRALICDSLKARKIGEPVLLGSSGSKKNKSLVSNNRLNNLGNRTNNSSSLNNSSLNLGNNSSSMNLGTPSNSINGSVNGIPPPSFKPRIRLNTANNSPGSPSLGKLRPKRLMNTPNKNAEINNLRRELNNLANKV